MKQTLKIGDRVKVIKKDDHYYKDIGVIVDKSKCWDWRVEFNEIYQGDNVGFYTESELQLIKPKSKKVCVHCGKEYKKDERCIGRVGGYYHELESKIKKVKKFSTDGEHFYINKQPVCEKEFLEQSKNIREIDKIKDIIKSNKLQYPNPFGKYIQVKRYNEILLPKIENELIEMLLSTQTKPIKEEGMTVEEFIDTSKKIREDLKQQSKDIEPFKTVFTYSKNYPDLCATQTDEFRKWVKQVTDTLNSLTKRK